ncbi:MAG: sigma-70 family RNA polymerase sigma factor [Planctomycetes bacterium]|nr:sigma-70 family RNA polymerase sigma factor [Planctomycetota bacterium]
MLRQPEPPDSNEDTETLVTRSRSGDARALENLLVNFLPELHAFCRLNLGDRLAARESTEDIVQSTCREVLLALGDFEYRGPAQFRRWLFLHVLRKIQARGRFWGQEKRDVALRPFDEQVDGVADYGAMLSPSQQAIRAEDIERLERAFERLSPEQREVLTCSKFLGMSSQEIGERLGKPAGTVRVLLHRAVAKLAIELDSESGS